MSRTIKHRVAFFVTHQQKRDYQIKKNHNLVIFVEDIPNDVKAITLKNRTGFLLPMSIRTSKKTRKTFSQLKIIYRKQKRNQEKQSLIKEIQKMT